MANEQNLRYFTSDQSREEAVKNGKKGGEANREAWQRKKLLREAMQVLMDSEITDKNGQKITGTEAMAAKAFQAALKGDWKAWELVRDTAGQKPVDRVVHAEVDPDVINEVETMIKEAGNNDEERSS